MRRLLSSVLFLLLISAGAFPAKAMQASLTRDVFTPGKETGGITVMLQQPGDVRVSLWKDGQCLRVLDNRFVEGTEYGATWDGMDRLGKVVPPGAYTLRVEAGETIAPVTAFGDQGAIDGPTSPWQAQVDPAGNIWVLDYGEMRLYKFSPDGKPANDFDEDNYLPVLYAHSFVIGSDGNLYLKDFNDFMKKDAAGNKLVSYGGLKTVTVNGVALRAPESTEYPQVFGFGPGGKIYVYDGGFKVFDGAKEKNEAFLYTLAGPNLGNLPAGVKDQPYSGPAFASNAETGSIYFLTDHFTLGKVLDSGPEVKSSYIYSPAHGTPQGVLINPVGLGVNIFSEVYIADWGGSRLVKCFDTGSSLQYVTSFGMTGADLAKIEFAGLHGVTVEGDNLYIVEDGELLFDYAANSATGRVGNHRVSKWQRSFSEMKEFTITVR